MYLSINATPEELKIEFSKAIINDDIKDACNIQQYSFSAILNGKLPIKFLAELEIPFEKKYARLINTKIVNQFLIGNKSLTETYDIISKLKELDPKNKEITYNYIALQIKQWHNGNLKVDYRTFKGEIINLIDKGIDKTLVYRMLINYYIIITDMYLADGDYSNSERCINIIQDKYKLAKLSTTNLLGVAQFFAFYTKFEWATKAIEPYITRLDVDEDLLFYYINLTIDDRSLTTKKAYKKVLLNAIGINKNRFCIMFNSIYMGGVSFQLLDDKYLKKNYCQSCKDL